MRIRPKTKSWDPTYGQHRQSGCIERRLDRLSIAIASILLVSLLQLALTAALVLVLVLVLVQVRLRALVRVLM